MGNHVYNSPTYRASFSGSFNRFPLNPEARIEQPVIRAFGFPLLAQRFRGLRVLRVFAPAPRHRQVAVVLARRAGENQAGVSELAPVDRQHVLEHELRRVVDQPRATPGRAHTRGLETSPASVKPEAWHFQRGFI